MYIITIGVIHPFRVAYSVLNFIQFSVSLCKIMLIDNENQSVLGWFVSF